MSTSLIESPLAHLSPEQIEELAPRVRRDPRRRLRGPRRARPPLHREHDRDAPPAARDEPGGAAVLAPPAGMVGGHRDAVARKDPREHGDRPQRAARPVGLDERPLHPLLHLGLGHGVDLGGVEALAQLRAPHVHQHPRQGPRPRLRDHAHRPAPALASRVPVPAALQPGARVVLRVGSRRARPRLRGDPQGREVEGAGEARAEGNRRQGEEPGRQGLHRLAADERSRDGRARLRARASRAGGAERSAGVPFDRDGELHRERDPQRVVVRDHLLRALPGSDLHVQRGGGDRRGARRVVRAPAGGRREHRGQSACST